MKQASGSYVVFGCRTFKIKAAEVSGAAQKLTDGLSGKRDLAKLSPWLAEYSPASGKLLLQLQTVSLRLSLPCSCCWTTRKHRFLRSHERLNVRADSRCNHWLQRKYTISQQTSECWVSALSDCTGGEQSEALLMPWMPSMGGLNGSLPPDVHIVGFGKTASVFSSKQKPKELTVYGSDFRCHPFSHSTSYMWHCMDVGDVGNILSVPLRDLKNSMLVEVIDGNWCSCPLISYLGYKIWAACCIRDGVQSRASRMLM